MKITLLGTGTSQGIPVIGCTCEVCSSKDIRDNRLRTSAHVSTQDCSLVIDIGPDFRSQMLSAQVKKLDGILITHEHNDHVIGLDDVRPYCFIQKDPVELYAIRRVKKEIEERFEYAFRTSPYPGAPRLNLNQIDFFKTFHINNLSITAFPVIHGRLEIAGYKINNTTYITDASDIPEDSMKLIANTDLLVINALRRESHPSHYTLTEAIEAIKNIKPEKTILTHLSHLMGLHAHVEKELPHEIILGSDGMEVIVSDMRK